MKSVHQNASLLHKAKQSSFFNRTKTAVYIRHRSYWVSFSEDPSSMNSYSHACCILYTVDAVRLLYDIAHIVTYCHLSRKRGCEWRVN